nr:reverse transcriptase domain-containing protein [Tanacetum cinerariifolium]
MPKNIKLYDGTVDPEDHLSRFSSAANSREWPMPVWCQMFQQTLGGPTRGWFERLPTNNIDEWSELREGFTTRYSVRKACFKEPHEIKKILRKANESIKAFKERWTKETCFIMRVSEVMKISSFIDSLKCLELAKPFSVKTPKMMDEMMARVDDFVRLEEAFSCTELSKGETGEQHIKTFILTGRREERPYGHIEEKGHYTNDYMQLRRQLEMTLESGKLNQLVKYIRQRGRGNCRDKVPQPEKVSNMIEVISSKERKMKNRVAMEEWMNTPITFPPVPSDDVSDEPLIVESEVKGYLVRRVYVDEGAPVEVMFEHCFENLSLAIKSMLKATQTDLVDFSREISKMVGKIELDVCFGNEGLCRRTTMKCTIIRAPSPYNIILGRTRLKMLRAIPLTIYSMMQFPTLKGIASFITNLEAYADDMVIKSNDEKALLADIAETFDNLKKINMKLNMKKCSFDVEEGKFLSYMVTSKGIRMNPKMTKVLVDLQSPRTLKEMRSLSGMLVALNMFMAKSIERSLHFFNTLRNIMKENKHEYKWTPKAEKAFEQMKKLILSLLSLTSPFPNETMYAYLAVSIEVVSVVLITYQKGRHCLVHYVNRTLNEAEKNYAPMEKLALSLIHITRRLRR